MTLFDVFKKKALSPVSTRGGWFPWRILEAKTGDWQKNIEWSRETVLCFPAVFSCINLISSDISKMSVKYVRKAGSIWEDVDDHSYKVVNSPNDYQNRIQFYESWVNSKLIRGNAYILKDRDRNGKVTALHVLHPDKVLPMVSDDGQVFYQLGQDNLSGIQIGSYTVPASEIIHDRFNCFFHPLVGLSPLFASGLPASMGMKVLESSTRHFENGSRPSGILVVPQGISQKDAEELSAEWHRNYGGKNLGKTAILGGDIKYQALSMTAEESQLVEQLKLTSELVCATFRVPAYKIIGTAPTMTNVEALEQTYYSQCLQVLIEAIELLLDEGLGVPVNTGFEFDLDTLLRMDSKTQVETLSAAVKGGIDTPNEARRKRNQKPLVGGDTVYMQHQDYPIEMIYNRTDLNGEVQEAAPENGPDAEKQMMMLALKIKSGLKEVVKNVG